MLVPVLGRGRPIGSAGGPFAPTNIFTSSAGLRNSPNVPSFTLPVVVPDLYANQTCIFLIGGMTNSNGAISATFDGSPLDTIAAFVATVDVSTPFVGCYGLRNVSPGTKNLVVSGTSMFSAFYYLAVFSGSELHPSVYCLDTPICTTTASNSTTVVGSIVLTEPAYILELSVLQGNDGGTPTIDSGFTTDFAGQVPNAVNTATDGTFHAGRLRADTVGTKGFTVTYGASDGRASLIVPIRGK